MGRRFTTPGVIKPRNYTEIPLKEEAIISGKFGKDPPFHNPPFPKRKSFNESLGAFLKNGIGTFKALTRIKP